MTKPDEAKRDEAKRQQLSLTLMHKMTNPLVVAAMEPEAKHTPTEAALLDAMEALMEFANEAMELKL